MYNMDDKVTTPSGTGYVCYVEDDYIEVDVAGNEIGFYAPFNNIKPYEPGDSITIKPKFDPEREDAKFADIEIPYTIEMLARTQHNMATLAVQCVGGEVDAWEDLSTRVKLNYVAVAMGWGNAETAAEKIKNQEL